ncbi:hypothetical protein HK100_010555, partial [Physocladia obscura]
MDGSSIVGDLKKAIRAEKGLPGSVELTLVRIYKADVGGLTADELERSAETFSLTAYGEHPERGKDDV